MHVMEGTWKGEKVSVIDHYVLRIELNGVVPTSTSGAVFLSPQNDVFDLHISLPLT